MYILNMSIHTIGDSHSINGWHPSNDWYGIIKTHHLRGILCYSFGRDKLDRCDIRMFNIKDGDTIIFCFGEIDCRCHIHKHITNIITYQDIINNIVDNYFKAIELNVSISQIKLKNVCVYNVVPPVQKNIILRNVYDYTGLPILGTDEERKCYILYFNEKLKEKCIENNYIFFDIYNDYIDENGFMIENFRDATIHICNGYYITKFIKENLK